MKKKILITIYTSYFVLLIAILVVCLTADKNNDKTTDYKSIAKADSEYWNRVSEKSDKPINYATDYGFKKIEKPKETSVEEDCIEISKILEGAILKANGQKLENVYEKCIRSRRCEKECDIPFEDCRKTDNIKICLETRDDCIKTCKRWSGK